MKKNLIYILGIIVALLILFSGWSGDLNTIKSEGTEALMFNSDNEIGNAAKIRYRFARQSVIQPQEADSKRISYATLDYARKTTQDYDITTE